MNEELKAQGVGTPDKVKLTLAIVLVVGGVLAYYVLDAQPTWLRWLAVAAGVLLAAGVLAVSQYGRDFKQFVLDSRIELRKIVWPTRRETGLTTMAVFLFVIVAGVFFWVVDLVLAWATRHLTGQGG